MNIYSYDLHRFYLRKLLDSSIKMGNAYLMFVVLLSVEGVFAAEADPMMQFEVMEGDSVKLGSCVTKIQKDDEVEWTFGPHVIATIKASNPLLYDTDDAKFKDRLHLDSQTGDLTIRNTRIKHSGLYEVKIISITSTTHKCDIRVTVLDAIPKKVSVTEGYSVTLQHDIADMEIYENIQWMFEDGKTPIAQINKKNSKSPSYSDERFEDRLQLDQTGSLTITNAKTTDAGLYKLQVMTQNIGAKNRIFRVTVSESGLSTGVIVAICVSVLAVIVLVVGIWCWKKQHETPY